MIRRKVGSNVEIQCVVREECPGQPWKYEWFSFKEKYHIRLKLREGLDKYRLNGAHLRISSLQVNDSGIYHCAAVSQGKLGRGTQHVGPGTTLIVKGERERNVLRVVERIKAEVGETHDVCLFFFCFVYIYIYREDGEKRYSVGGIHSPVSLQPGCGDSYCKEGNSFKKVIALNWVPGCKCFFLFAVQLQKDSPNQ